MATEIVRRILCDFCQADDVDTPDARTMSVTIGGDTYEVDVCEFHGKPLTELADTLSALGRKLPKRGRPPADGGQVKPSRMPSDVPQQCPVCAKSFPNRASVGSHTRRIHDKTLAELEGAPLNHVCEFCGTAFGTPQGKAVHEQRGHRDEYAARSAAAKTGTDTTS